MEKGIMADGVVCGNTSTHHRRRDACCCRANVVEGASMRVTERWVVVQAGTNRVLAVCKDYRGANRVANESALMVYLMPEADYVREHGPLGV